LDLGYSEHLAQILLNANRPERGPVKIRKRQFTKESTDKFNYLLQKESWQENLSNSDIKTFFNALKGIIIIIQPGSPRNMKFLYKDEIAKWF
jgi:hypothetical protein